MPGGRGRRNCTWGGGHGRLLGQDGILLSWARWDGEKLTGWDVNEDLDCILTDVRAGHSGFLTVEHYGADLRRHALDGTVLAGRGPGSADDEYDDEDETYWDYTCGFVDAETVIASTVESDEDPEQARHWLLDAHTLRIRGVVTYPTGPVDKLRTATRRRHLAHVRRQERDAQPLGAAVTPEGR
ncbi:hypothetical protein [Streptomyces sp. NPDC007984]|uniref:hypothetical protein n=1 Tax=Streptomyces sp. NPDC007984 TaxID=3364801 RepID=UPI0036EF6B9F